MMDTKKSRKGKVVQRFWLVLAILVASTIFFSFTKDILQLFFSGDQEGIKAALTRAGVYPYIFMLIIMLIQNTFTVIPLLLVITVNIAIFGFANGFLWSWFTSVIAAIVVYLCVKYLFQNWLVNKFNPELIEKIEREGFVYVFQARVFPFVPTSLVNIVAGLSSVRFWHFLLGTVLGNFIYFFVLALIPTGLLSANLDENVLMIIVFLLFGLFIVMKKVYNKKRKQQDT